MHYDIAVIGGTPGGIACAVRAAREGLTVVLVNFTRHLGGMIASGLGVTDTLYDGRRAPIYEEFRARVLACYEREYGKASVQYETCRANRSLHFEPKVGERALTDMVTAESRIHVLYERYPDTVERSGERLLAVTVASFRGEEPLRLTAGTFVDATYEGDLTAAAGVPWRVGRESRQAFNEQHAGRIFSTHGHGQYPLEAQAGLLHINTFGVISQQICAGSTGLGDQAVQAYNFRMCLTDDPHNRKLPARPDGYDRNRYLGIVEHPLDSLGKPYALKSQLLLGDVNEWRIRGKIPNRKTTWNDPTMPGANHDYPTGDWQTREASIRAHRDHALGMLYFLQNDEAVPEAVRERARCWGLALDEFADNDHIPYEMYVREARRIVGRHIFTEHDASLAPGLERTPIHHDAVAIAEWPMDSHECTADRRPGTLNEGKFLLSESTRPSQIPYRCMLPLGVDNLLVPVCLSSTHVGWGTLRLEPVWMHVGEVAGYAAALARKDGVAPASLPVRKLQRCLVEHGVMISFFNEFDMRSAAEWVPAVQYFGAKGFFASYNAEPEAPLDEATARQWARMAAVLLGGEPEARPDDCARKLLALSGDRATGIDAARFERLLRRELDGAGVAAGAEAAVCDEAASAGAGGMLTRGAACTMLYRLLHDGAK